MQEVVQLKNISKTYGSQTILKNLNLSIKNGEFLTLLGPSGCGKTTILRIIAGFEMPDSGDVILKNEVITHLPPNKRSTNTVFQSYALFPHLNVFDNVAFGLRMKKIPKDEIKDRVFKVLERVRLKDFIHRKPNELSGGQQQRVAIARAIVNEPLVLLLDEPLSALDYKLRKEMQIELKELQKELGITFLFVTHDQEEALSMSDRVVVLKAGEIMQIGTPKEIYEEPKNLFVAQFVGESNIFEGTVKEKLDGSVVICTEYGEFVIKTKKEFEVGKNISILLRPEDLRLERKESDVVSKNYLKGIVKEIIYKGTIIDLLLELSNGKRILASEFYNEDSDALMYEYDEEIFISWVDGWECLLED